MGIQVVTRVTRGYRGLKGVSGGYRWLQGVTGAWKGLQKTGFLTRTSPDTFSVFFSMFW